MTEPFRVLSLGAGIDSSTVLLLSEHGELPRLDAAIFADTMAEPQGVYETLDWLAAATSIPIYRVSKGDFAADMLAFDKGTQVYAPFYMRTETGVSGAPLGRRCTRDYKIRPIRRKIRELLAHPSRAPQRGNRVEQWIGFSLDDMGRTFCSDVQWLTNVFPLILPLRMRRRDCIAWLQAHGYPVPPKSSCLFCPYHSNSYWRDMRDHRPEEWQQTVAFEAQLQHGKPPGMRGTPYLHHSMVPLPMAPLDVLETGQEELFCMHCNT
jgi:hypothetical protein